jgi:TatD DNase family protein|tara:strand:- start:915 stop:1673 length:759 start_codon:yes stop_codon:yes gene_type:complete
MFIDIHTHIAQYKQEEIDNIINRWRLSNIITVVSAGTTLEDSLISIELAKKYPDILSGVGLHPSDLKDTWKNDLLSIEKLVDENVVMISEIGLDYMPNSPLKKIQIEAFETQIEIAIKYKKPIVIHIREAFEDTYRILKKFKGRLPIGAVHYFDGDYKEAKLMVDLGLYISFAKTLIRKDYLKDVAINLPLESIVLETDSYPQYFKKNRLNWTEPKDVTIVAEELSRVKKIDIIDVSSATLKNSNNLLGIID